MPCFTPLQAFYLVDEFGKKRLSFANRDFSGSLPSSDNFMQLPCGKCIGCKLESSRQFALRCLHESKCHEDNCFVTLTYDDVNLPSSGSLIRKDPQDFMKRLREFFSFKKIRFFGCGEYGDLLARPHYHLCLFNFDFPDRKKFSKRDGFTYYTSDILNTLWGLGHCLVTDFSFETAAYVARYCTKKVTGDIKYEYYDGRLPEFSMMSNRPGIGAHWLEQYGESDVFPHDSCIARGRRCKPPRYYDKLLQRLDPFRFESVKEIRKRGAERFADDNSPDRLAVRLKCLESRYVKLLRRFESGSN